MADTFHSVNPPPLLPTLEVATRAMYRTIKNNGLGDQLGRLCERVPAITGANQRLAAYLPSSIRHPYHDTPLFTVCLRDATKDAFATSHAGDIGAYFATLLERASLVLRYDLADHRGRWDPLYGEPLTLWLKSSRSDLPPPNPPPAPIRVSLGTFIQGMYCRLLPDNAIPEIQHLRGRA